MDTNYYEIGYVKSGVRYYVETIYKSSMTYDNEEQDAMRIPNKKLAVGIAQWLKMRDCKAEYEWFVVEKVTTENVETV